MNSITWLLIAYLLALTFLSINRQKFSDTGSLRMAWLWLAGVPLSHFFFSLFRAGNFGSTRDLALVEIWADGFAWLLLGISLLCLAGILAPDRNDKAS